MPRVPILPASSSDPTGVDRLERGAMREFDRRMRKIRDGYLAALDRIPAQPVVNEQYTYRLDQALLSAIFADTNLMVDEILQEGGERDLWFFESYVGVAYIRGTAQTHANLAQQSPAYRAGRESLDVLLRSDAYRARMALLRAREFEEMKGLSGQVKADMARILAEGMGRGKNPREIARDLTAQTGIEARRGHRIARTEVTTALRRARWDEKDAAEADYGVQSKLMHMSALSPSTRATHAARHARLYTSDEVRDWYSRDGNSINCYLPGTRVRGRFVAGSKAYYEGPAIELVTAGGRVLAVTPNHPIMTCRGLIPAHKIMEGDDLLANRGEVEDAPGVGDLNDKHGCSSVEDVFGALMESGHSFFSGVNAVDLHGDGRLVKGDIHVVRANCPLTFGMNPSLEQGLDHLGFEHTNSVFSLGRSPLGPNLVGLDLSTPNGDGGLGNGSPGGRIEAGVPLQGAHLSVSPLHPAFRQDSLDHASGYSGLPGNGLFGLSSQISADKVVMVKRFDFCGHVYDLEELSGLMVAGEIIASNCKCSQVEVLVDDEGNPVVPAIVERARRNYQVMKAKGRGPWAKED